MMTVVNHDALPQTWTNRDLPVLRSALRRLDEGDYFPNLEQIRQELELSIDQMRIAVDALTGAAPPYMTVTLLMGGPNQVAGHVDSVSERARRELGTWPTSAGVVDELVAALERAAAAETEPDKRSRLHNLAAGLTGFAREIAVGVITNKLNGL
jgi:hypothetical protein